MATLALFVSLLFVFSLVSRRLEQTIVTAPIVFTVGGMLISPVASQGILRSGFSSNIALRVAEVGLVMLLFADASRTDLKVLRNIRNLPGRLLSGGMLLTIILGTAAAWLAFPHFSIWEAGILSAILAPTDAGLGQVIVSSPRVPTRIREALTAEAGLNDGLSVPFLLFFIAGAAARIEGKAASLMQFIVEQLGLGALIGIAIGLAGGWLLGLARRKEWMTGAFQAMGVIALPLLCMAISEMLDASMFIAAFVAGLAVQVGLKNAGAHSIEFAEESGQFLNFGVFFVFGVAAMRELPHFGMASWLYAVLSLTLVRMLPVAVALVGTRLSAATVAFIGWFGPRGLASIVLGLVYLEQEMDLPAEPMIRSAVMATVLLSIFAHGLTAMPGIGLYVNKIESLPLNAPEHLPLLQPDSL